MTNWTMGKIPNIQGEHLLDFAISAAHEICSEKLLFETVEMEDEEIRLFLESNQVTSSSLQGRYFDCLKMYKAAMKLYGIHCRVFADMLMGEVSV